MNRFSIIIFSVYSCASPTSGPAGARGETGAPGSGGMVGDTGPRGDTGPAGICDSNSCPTPTVLDGLVDVSTQTLQVKHGTFAPVGVTIESGGKKTSIGGFYCGSTSFLVNGNFYDAAHAYGGLTPKRRAKRLCEDACSKPAAHPCTTAEIQDSQYLGGGNSATRLVDPNPTVPMPPNGSASWVMALDPTTSCNDLTGDGTNEGTVFSLASDEGAFSREVCTATHPLLCCL